MTKKYTALQVLQDIGFTLNKLKGTVQPALVAPDGSTIYHNSFLPRAVHAAANKVEAYSKILPAYLKSNLTEPLYPILITHNLDTDELLVESWNPARKEIRVAKACDMVIPFTGNKTLLDLCNSGDIVA